MMKEKHQHYSFGVEAELKIGDTKVDLASHITLQMTKSQKFWVLEYFVYQCTLLIKGLSINNFSHLTDFVH